MNQLVCTRTFHLENPASLKTYQSIGGYSAWEKILKEKSDPVQMLEVLKQSGLRGRGGAGFPTGVKWGLLKRDTPGQKYLVCNSDEGEPGTCKDRDILRFNPHQVIEGMLIASYVLGATVAYNYIRGEFLEPIDAFEKALKEAYAAGFMGKNILNAGSDIDIFTFTGAGSYICGEETALLNSLEGKKGMPRFKPPFPANLGLYGRPTMVNNTETLASVPPIFQHGAEWFLNLGRPNNGGTKIFCISGDVEKPMNIEVSLGTPFKTLLDMAGGVSQGNVLKAVIPGGSSMPILPAHLMLACDMDYDSLVKAGSMLGSGGIIVLDHRRCMVAVAENLSRFYSHESCGRCTPCREGSGWLYRLIKNIRAGHATKNELEQLKTVADNIEGRTICAFGEATAWPIQALLRHFKPEFETHLEGKCLAQACFKRKV